MTKESKGAIPPQESGESMYERAMKKILKRAEEAEGKGGSFEGVFLSYLESDGYTGGMHPVLKEALDKRDIIRLVDIAHADGWL